MYKKSLLQSILLGLITILFAASCDKDFNELGTDIVGDDHYGFENYSDASIKAYNQKLGPIASNNLAVNPLGFYTNPVFGTTQANFVTQIELTTLKPKFNNTVPADYQTPAVMDSVVMEIPYFAHIPKKSVITNNIRPYVLDSIYGDPGSKFKLSVYQSNYYLRDLDPSQSLAETQDFYTDEDNTIDNYKIPVLLNDAAQTAEAQNLDGHENSAFYFDKREHRTMVLDDDGTTPIYTRSVPSMRLHLSKSAFTNLILTAPEGKLDNNSVFKTYFRGLYFKVEGGNPGHMAMINFRAGKITLYYKEDKKLTSGTIPTFERINKTYVLNMTGNTVSLLNNSNENLNYLNAANSSSEAAKLYLKGGEGSVGMIDLFGDPADSNYDTYGYKVYKLPNQDGDLVPVDENDIEIPLDVNGDPLTDHYLIYKKDPTPNGIADELDELRYPAHLTVQEDPGQIIRSIKNRWMINEANLIFNIDTNTMADVPGTNKTIEPGRIFIYDLTNRKPIFDYTYDFTTNSLFPKFNKGIFGGILLNDKGKILKQKDDATGEFVKKGTKYKIRITNHIRNLIKNDSTNVRLGVAVTENINNIGFSKLKIPNTNFKSAPTMSVMNPLGTVLYGTGSAAPSDKKLKLEIYYTKPKNN